jgi:predicted DNA-binding helix-hairpin-helix protein
MDQLYSDWKLKRVYFVPFRPVRYTPMEEHPPTPSERENRLYQMDWLKRVYHFKDTEIRSAFDRRGFLDLDQDPKTVIALENIDRFPVDLNTADLNTLLRTPGIGPVSADRILRHRRRFRIDNWRDLKAMGVVRKKATPFVVFSGHRPEHGRQLRLELLGHAEPRGSVDLADLKTERGLTARASGTPARSTTASPATCGVQGTCTGCPLYGAPGHPGSRELAHA